jgi:hypothetical protein
MMYNERLGELETEIRKGKTNFEMLSKLNNKRAKDQGLISYILQIGECPILLWF